MSDTYERENGNGEVQEVMLGGMSMVDEQGRLSSGVEKVQVTREVLETILGKNNMPQLRDPIGSYRTTGELTQALITEQRDAHIPGPADLPGDHVNEMSQEDDRPFLGVSLEGKVKPRNLPDQGKDPLGIRSFIGDEFPRMLMYGPPKVQRGFAVNPETGEREMVQQVVEEAKPAFWSHFKKSDGSPIESMDDLKGQRLRINIATKLPDYMTTGEIAAGMDARREFSFRGKSLEESFTPITDKVEKAWRRFAKEYEKTTGLKVDVRRDDSDSPHDEADVNMTVCGFAGGNPQLAGFANFPGAIKQWGGGLQSLGHEQGYMMLNQDYCNSPLVDEDMIYDLVFHEFGHFMGMVHPHDLGAMRMSQPEALNNTAMAYTDAKFTRFSGQEGAVCGAVDMGLRNYMPEPPELNTDHGQVYDMEVEYKRCLGENADSQVMAMTRMMPTIPIVNNGTGTVLRGSSNGDIIDTEPGHVSFRQNALGIKQGYALVEGHIEKVIGRAGNNHIFLSSKGSQEVHPGPGMNHIHIYAPNIGDNKVIHSTGNDKLVLHQDLFLANPDMKVEQDGNDIVFTGKGGSITLKDQLVRGKGISSLAVLDDEGRAVMQQDTRRFTISGFNTDVIQPMKRHVRRIKAAEKEEAQLRAKGMWKDDEPPADFENTLPERTHDPFCVEEHKHGAQSVLATEAGNDNSAREQDAPEQGESSAAGNYLERLRKERNEEQAKGARGI